MINKKIVISINSIFLALFPIINNYAIISGFGFGDAILFFLMILNLFVFKIIYYKKYLWLLITLIYGIIITLFQHFFYDYGNLLSLFRQFGFILCVISIYKNINFDKLKKTIIIVSIISCVFSLFSFVVFKINGTIIPWFLNIKLNYGDGNPITYMNSYKEMYSYNYRSTGFFMEPSYFAQYLMVAIIILMSKPNKNYKDLMKICVIVLSILLTKSLFGYVAVLIVFFYYLMKYLLSGKILVSRMIVFLLGGCFLVIYFMLFNWNTISSVISRFGGIKDTGTSTNYRMFNWINILKALSPFQMIFGLGASGYVNLPIMQEMESNYITTLPYIISSYGLVGFACFITFVFKMRSTNFILWFILLLLIIIESIFINAFFVLLIILLSENKKMINYDVNNNVEFSSYNCYEDVFLKEKNV